MDNAELIELNSYIIIQRRGYFKLHQLVSNSNAMLGKDKVNLSNVVGKPYWTVFKMIPCQGKKRDFDLEECSKAESVSKEIMKDFNNGSDNRNITDDGCSQTLSREDIDGMRESGISGHAILEKLVENSKTFKEKTEFSQEKYLKKKEKKYFEYIIVRKPTLRLIIDIFYSRDPLKIMGLRHDILSQIFTTANILHDGVYALFENGSQALVAAGILNFLSDSGFLINLTLGSNPQKQAVLSMNFKKEKLGRLVNVRMKDILKCLELGGKEVGPQMECKFKVNGVVHGEETTKSGESALAEEACVPAASSVHGDAITTDLKNSALNSDNDNSINCDKIIQTETESNLNKRKNSSDESQPTKKPRWAEDLERAVEAFTTRKLNGIVIVAKEYPLNIVVKLLPFLKPSCQLVIYCSFREPLVQLYIELKKRKDVLNIRLTENWLRNYQVLPERTHPDVNMSFSGHLLIATKVV